MAKKGNQNIFICNIGHNVNKIFMKLPSFWNRDYPFIKLSNIKASK